jgi:hypothetical protein
MRLWSLHPKYLDSKGLVALWREGLLAQAVLANKTIGYRNHPQLERFKAERNPLRAIRMYLDRVHQESVRRGYEFDERKILLKPKAAKTQLMTVNHGQLKFEWEHLLSKLTKRDPAFLSGLGLVSKLEANLIFRVVPGGVANWEKF